jgi:hypothetical protein
MIAVVPHLLKMVKEATRGLEEDRDWSTVLDEMREGKVSLDEDISVGDFYEGVLLETCRDENRSITRPRVRPLQYFPKWMRVEFPRSLREKHPIGTRFRADVIVAQKHWSNGVAKGSPYLAARPSSIVRDVSYKLTLRTSGSSARTSPIWLRLKASARRRSTASRRP